MYLLASDDFAFLKTSLMTLKDEGYDRAEVGSVRFKWSLFSWYSPCQGFVRFCAYICEPNELFTNRHLAHLTKRLLKQSLSTDTGQLRCRINKLYIYNLISPPRIPLVSRRLIGRLGALLKFEASVGDNAAWYCKPYGTLVYHIAIKINRGLLVFDHCRWSLGNNIVHFDMSIPAAFSQGLRKRRLEAPHTRANKPFVCLNHLCLSQCHPWFGEIRTENFKKNAMQ